MDTVICVIIFIVYRGKQTRPRELSELSYTESLGSPTGTGLTLAISSLPPTAALSHHSALAAPLFWREKETAEDSSRDIGPSFLVLGEQGENTGPLFLALVPESKAEEGLHSPVLQGKVEVESRACASACW